MVIENIGRRAEIWDRDFDLATLLSLTLTENDAEIMTLRPSMEREVRGIGGSASTMTGR